jgi:hypothetical protein
MDKVLLNLVRTRADLSYALVHNLIHNLLVELLTHYAKRAENERCFSTVKLSGTKLRMLPLLELGRIIENQNSDFPEKSEF